MAGWAKRTAALAVGTACGVVVGNAIDRSRRAGSSFELAAPTPLALLAATSMAGTVRSAAGLDRRSPWLHLGIGFLTGLFLTTFGDAAVAALDD